MKSNKRKKRQRKRRRARDRKRGRDTARGDELVLWSGAIGSRAEHAVTARVRVDLEELEIARGHDGLLRGKPEPVIIAGTYVVDGNGARVAARTVWRLDRPSRFPCSVRPREDGADARVRVAPPAALVLLAFALEEDAGTDIARLFGALERVDAITMWPCDNDVPAPLHIDELAREADAWREWRAIHVMIDETHVGEDARDDDWIGAAALVTPCAPRLRTAQRAHFVSEDGRNDWTAAIAVRL